ncbi:LLM class flavin-dependent oxidoreductase [Flexivirga oryzae]|uniref:Alkanesulfonate monooxygenase SsuD/methylene tetrahydromethanopterin reductase-like flavin-dependent oxidoreductase (Luciferase family) n=1 Tax=Flexivirga oryzae TaxID=1794944 RepID=A0A839N7G2_9MICO|nr:LLM class flavin-dependent oxidoreductase [Flexivirga oryzae]MBB2893207.1 alkanesulfonate monooxygenase SsuD/methylene tetrahydromethanopterin reductase-like flavin-dependent oxidoreductase (luciferase family) [Flexivirga oryzae]
MKAFGFLSFGHYGRVPGSQTQDAASALKQSAEIGVGADEIGVNGAYFRVHHFERQLSSPIPLLSTIAARTKHIEVGTGVIDMRYENPLQLAEELGALDLLSDQRLAIGISRGSPETAVRGYEAFGYTGAQDPRGADVARDKFATFLAAIDGAGLVDADPQRTMPGIRLRIEPRSAGLRDRIWWGSSTRETAEWVGNLGLNLMSSTLLTEANGASFADLQREQIDRFRAAYVAAGHTGRPRVSVSRSIFPIVDERDAAYFGGARDSDQVGIIDGYRSTFGKTYADAPDKLIEQLRGDAAVMAADTVMLTIPNQLGVDYNLHVLQAFAEHVAPALGWRPNTTGPVEGDDPALAATPAPAQ